MINKQLKRLFIEWPTWVAIITCYLLWGMVIYWHDVLDWMWVVPATFLVAFHSSLQHEASHGHPTKFRTLNELLVFFPLGLFIPYLRFKALHLQHHNNALLTDPYDDPESWYLPREDWDRKSTFLKALLRANATLGGRLLLGPALMLVGFVKSELLLLINRDLSVIKAWLFHCAGVVIVLAILISAEIDISMYLIAVAYFAISLIMIRSYIEHRAVRTVSARTAIIEAGQFMSLLFLNNNLHSVHHMRPTAPWYQLPEIWERHKDPVLIGNKGYYYPGGYAEVFKKWFFVGREPLIHPL